MGLTSKRMVSDSKIQYLQTTLQDKVKMDMGKTSSFHRMLRVHNESDYDMVVTVDRVSKNFMSTDFPLPVYNVPANDKTIFISNDKEYSFFEVEHPILSSALPVVGVEEDLEVLIDYTVEIDFGGNQVISFKKQAKFNPFVEELVTIEQYI